MMYGSYNSEGMVQDPVHRRHQQPLSGPPPPLPPPPLSMSSSSSSTVAGTTQPDFAGFDGDSKASLPLSRSLVRFYFCSFCCTNCSLLTLASIIFSQVDVFGNLDTGELLIIRLLPFVISRNSQNSCFPYTNNALVHISWIYVES